jgi:hypothetical protein
MNVSLIQDCLRTIDSEMIQASMSPEELESLRQAYLQRVMFIEQLKTKAAA